MLSEVFLVLAVTCSASLANMARSYPSSGAFLCFTGNRVNVRSEACGSSEVGFANSGSCYKYKGSKQSCSMGGTSYDFYRLDYGGRDGWAAGDFLRQAPDSSCRPGSTQTGSGQSGTAIAGSYTCDITPTGLKVQEPLSATSYDCKDSSCKNTCKGGQCAAYVTCNCKSKRNGTNPPRTSCWRPEVKVIGSDGKCNRSIPPRTAIATFKNGRYYYKGHAAVFMGCNPDNSIKVFDQYCGRATGESTIGRSSSFYQYMYVITKSGVCADRTWSCRYEQSGPNFFKASVKGC